MDIVIFSRTVTDKVGNQKKLFTMPPALLGKTEKHENHIFHSIRLLHAQWTCGLSSWKKKCHLWCVW